MNYGELKDEVAAWLYNRNDLSNRIPRFISLAEVKFFRVLRTRANETTYDFPVTSSGVPIIYDSLALREDHLETKFVTFGGNPLTRISDIEIQRRRYNSPTRADTKNFGRVEDDLLLWPIADQEEQKEVPFQIAYWQNLSGNLSNDSDTNRVLTEAPDLYIYGALMEAAPYLADDKRIATWQKKYSDTLGELNFEYTRDDYSGSNVAVANAYPE